MQRRDFLRLAAEGVAAFSGTSWLGTLAARAAAANRKYKSCVLLYMAGGPPHLDTFDPKPEAPEEYRGKFKPIATAVPGIQVSELFPKFAQQMKHAAILRSMSHSDAGHE